MRRSEYPTFLDWLFVNLDEYRALATAEDGNPEPLATFVEEHGTLATLEGRRFVAARLRGEPLKRGAKRTVHSMADQIALLAVIRDIQRESDCSEYRATQIYLDRHPDKNPETVASDIKRAKATLKKIFGRAPSVVQKSGNSAP
jgi:hypothetical protein